MGRKPRGWSATGCYHVVTRGNNRQRIFRDAADQPRYVGLLAVAAQTHGCQLIHYCLMPNHVHLVVRAPEPAGLSQAMHELQRRYYFYMRKTYALSGHLWQGRYHSFPIEDDAYLLECGRYIERNPLQAGLVQDLADYPWSSYPWYAAGRERDIALTPSPGYLALGPTPEARQQAYRQYVLTTRPYDRAMSQTLTEVTVGV